MLGVVRLAVGGRYSKTSNHCLLFRLAVLEDLLQVVVDGRNRRRAREGCHALAGGAPRREHGPPPAADRGGEDGEEAEVCARRAGPLGPVRPLRAPLVEGPVAGGAATGPQAAATVSSQPANDAEEPGLAAPLTTVLTSLHLAPTPEPANYAQAQAFLKASGVEAPGIEPGSARHRSHLRSRA